jgi:hypothetical protein
MRNDETLVAVRALERLCAIQCASNVQPGLLASLRGQSDIAVLLGALAKIQKSTPLHDRSGQKTKLLLRAGRVGRPTEKKSAKPDAVATRQYRERLRSEKGDRLANRKAKQHAAYERWYAKLKADHERLGAYKAGQNRGYKERLIRATISP